MSGKSIRQARDRAVRVALAFLGVGVAVVSGAGSALGQDGYRVIVNSAAGINSLTREDAARVFLKETTAWPNGTAAVPVDLPAQSEIRERFSREVHGRSTAAIKAYWQGQVFSGRQVPPVEKATEQEVIAFVAQTPGAVGYVSSGTGLPAGAVAVAVNERDPAAGDAEVFNSENAEQAPQRVSMPPVRFPTQAIWRGVDGAVTMQFVVSEAGHVETESVTVISATSDAFAAAAREAVVQEVFRPARVRGRAVRCRVEQTIRFAQSGTR